MGKKKIDYIDLLASVDNTQLVISKDIDGNITAHLEGVYIKDGPFLEGNCGRGKTSQEAAADYLNQIKGKTLVTGSGEPRTLIWIV